MSDYPDGEPKGLPDEKPATLFNEAKEPLAQGSGWLLQDKSGGFQPLLANLVEEAVKYVEIDGELLSVAHFGRCRRGGNHYHFGI